MDQTIDVYFFLLLKKIWSRILVTDLSKFAGKIINVTQLL